MRAAPTISLINPGDCGVALQLDVGDTFEWENQPGEYHVVTKFVGAYPNLTILYDGKERANAGGRVRLKEKNNELWTRETSWRMEK